jgi:RhoGAP domain
VFRTFVYITIVIITIIMSNSSSDQIKALESVSSDYGVQGQVKHVCQLFQSLNVAEPGSADGVRERLEKASSMKLHELNETLRVLQTDGYDSLDFFTFALQNQIPEAAISAAAIQLKTESLDGNPFSIWGDDSKGDAKDADEALTAFHDGLIHQFPIVSRQVENGLYAVKRAAAYLKKVCAFEETYSKDVLKATAHETSKMERAHGDGMKRYVGSWVTLQEVVYQTAQQHQDFRAKVMSAVVLPLQAFYKENENKRKEILSRMKTLSNQMKATSDGVNKAKKKSLDYLQQLADARNRSQQVAVEPKPAASSGFFSKVSNKISKKFNQMTAETIPVLTDKAAAACAAYDQELVHANTARKRFRSQDLPKLFAEMQNLEIARLDVLKEHMAKFSLILHELVAPLEEMSVRMVNSVASMDTVRDMNEFVDTWVAVHGEPPKPVPYKYDLPTTPQELRANRWNFSMDVKEASVSVFGNTLPKIIELQKEKFPNFDVPAVVPTLVEAIRSLGGCKIEGIFRISAPKDQLEKLKGQFEKWDFKVASDSPHVPAGLLKQWMRELPEGLVPNHMYESCITLAQDDSSTSESALKLWQTVPALNQRVVSHLLPMFREICENVDTTRMSVDNIAIVFAPSFLRCPSDDPMTMMMNSKFETRFVSLLVGALLS